MMADHGWNVDKMFIERLRFRQYNAGAFFGGFCLIEIKPVGTISCAK
jgi:hypothetical protein